MENIAVAITTHNRPDDLDLCLSKWKEFYPSIKPIVVDDSSSPIYCDSDYRFENRVGISRAKNKCIELAMNTGAEHIFLADDDTYPISSGGLEIYCDAPFAHMCYSFTPFVSRVNREYKKHNLGNGCLLYMHRSVFEKIGGFDTTFFAKYEHTQFSHRCYYNGLIPHPYIDFIGSDKYFHCLDQEEAHKRTLTDSECRALLKEGKKHFSKTLASKDFINYICDIKDYQ